MTTTQSQSTKVPSWHAMPVADVLSAQRATEQGLDSAEASKRLAEVGPNRLPAPPKQHPILRFFAHFHNLLIYVLLASAAITSALGHFTDTLVILTVVVVNAIIGFVQEGKAEKAMDAIREMLAMKAAVLRMGHRQTVAGDDLVPGDVVLLEAGDKVPADMRLLWVNGLQMQEAILTGESVPAQKQTDAVSKDAPVGDRSCMAYSGTLVTSGLARGVVVATGGDTEIGRISDMLSTVELLTTPLLKQMDVFARWLTILILLIAGVLLMFGSVVGNYAFTDLFIAIKPSLPEHTVLEFSDVEEGLILVGLVGLMDPPRAEVIDAIAECQQAGIRVKMITGDHKGTATAIAKVIGLQNPHKVLTGAQIDTLSDHALSLAILDTDIFARTSPEHKMRLVKALQAHDLTVAMTGDGVNDAPALKRADAGIAMGMQGSEAAKEAAELVLVDDNFTSIVSAVREGRTVYDNIKKVISWTLPTNAGEAMTIIVALVFGMTLPITPIQILWVNLITAVTLGIALAFEPTDSQTMKRPPRQRGEALVSGELIWHILFASLLMLGGVFGVYTYAVNQGYSLELSRSMAVNTLVVLEIFQLFFIRNMHNSSISWQSLKGTKMVWLTVSAVTLAQLAMTYLPFMQSVFSTQAIGVKDGTVVLGIGVLFFALIETEKRLRLAVKAMRHK